jgi:L-threonylcarbamoyladenylate synthase
MKNYYSNIFVFNNKNIKKTIKYLNNGQVVGLPTETVYGLGGNAYSKKPLEKIYKLKGRPRSNPLIIHYYGFKNALKDVISNKNFEILFKKFCPGPITFVLKKKNNSKINSLSCANLNTIAIRFPKHRLVRSILKKINYPLAMPSANKSTNVSPVKAVDVFDEFGKKIKLIIDGGTCRVGIESTVIDLTKSPNILRPGIIGRKEIEKILKSKIRIKISSKTKKSPGMMKKHYSPGIPVKINQKKYDGKSAFIYLGNKYKHKKNYFSLSKNSNLDEAASNLYKMFRLIKKRGYKKIQISKIPHIGTGVAINDRIKRASKF